MSLWEMSDNLYLYLERLPKEIITEALLNALDDMKLYNGQSFDQVITRSLGGEIKEREDGSFKYTLPEIQKVKERFRYKGEKKSFQVLARITRREAEKILRASDDLYLLEEKVTYEKDCISVEVFPSVLLIKQRFGGKHGREIHNYFLRTEEQNKETINKMVGEVCDRVRCLHWMPV